MADVIRLNDVHKDLLKDYYNLLLDFYGSDCPLLPDSSDFSGIVRSALRDAISYREFMKTEN